MNVNSKRHHHKIIQHVPATINFVEVFKMAQTASRNIHASLQKIYWTAIERNNEVVILRSMRMESTKNRLKWTGKPPFC